jgi:polyisoprenoid-binding protein YceI
MEVSPGFPRQPDLAGPVNARVEAFIDARSLKSIEKDGKPFSNKMDGIMHEALKTEANPKIVYRLDRLLRKTSSISKDGPCQFEAQGRLVVAGVTNEVSMPVNVLTMPGDQLRVWGVTTVKMTDFHIDPPSPKITLGIIKTGDDVKLSFEWVLARRN